jgi:hypothetical protein
MNELLAGRAVRREIHNSEIHTAAADAHRCGMTHLASGQVCLLPERHQGGCDFRDSAEVGWVLAGS